MKTKVLILLALICPSLSLGSDFEPGVWFHSFNDSSEMSAVWSSGEHGSQSLLSIECDDFYLSTHVIVLRTNELTTLEDGETVSITYSIDGAPETSVDTRVSLNSRRVSLSWRPSLDHDFLDHLRRGSGIRIRYRIGRSVKAISLPLSGASRALGLLECG
jgi:hypothetical protein